MSILRHELNGIEFFTVEATGESGISHSGLALLCGVSKQAIDKLVINLPTSRLPKRLEAFADKDLHLTTNYQKQGGKVKILRASFCAAVIKHYALEGRDIAEHSMDKFMTLGINSWIQSITGWQVFSTPTTPIDRPQDSLNAIGVPNFDRLLEQIDILQHNLTVSLKHRHAIHNIVEKPTVVDLSLNQIIHTAVHVQANKLNQALATVKLMRENALGLQSAIDLIERSQHLGNSVRELTNTVEHIRTENDRLKGIVRQQKALLQSRRQIGEQYELTTIQLENLDRVLASRIEEICSILMQSQQRTGGTRAINTCTKRAKIYARYEIGQSLEEIAQGLNIPYETVKSYVKLTRAEIKAYYSQQN